MTLQRDLEGWIMSQICRVIAILVAGRDHHHPEPNDLRKAVLHLGRIAWIHNARRQHVSQSCPALHFPKKRQPCIRTHVSPVKTHQDRFAIHR